MAYFPDGSSRIVFDEQCETCIHEDPGTGCPIAYIQLNHNYDQIGNDNLEAVMDALVDENSVCQMKPLIEKYYRKRPLPLPDQLQMDLFDKEAIHDKGTKDER